MAIALDPTGGTNGGVRFWTVRTQKVVTRDSWPGGEIPLSETVIEIINSIAKAEGKPVLPRHVASHNEIPDIPISIIHAEDPLRTPIQKIIRPKADINPQPATKDTDIEADPTETTAPTVFATGTKPVYN